MTLSAYILALLILNPNHELVKNPQLREDVAGYFADAGEQYDLPPKLLVWWAYLESSLRVDVVGKLGEVGYAQSHGKSRATCEAAGLDVTTREGGAHCIAMLLDMGRRYCGDLYHGAIYYASGGCHGTPRTRKKIKWRLKEKHWKK